MNLYFFLLSNNLRQWLHNRCHIHANCYHISVTTAIIIYDSGSIITAIIYGSSSVTAAIINDSDYGSNFLTAARESIAVIPEPLL